MVKQQIFKFEIAVHQTLGADVFEGRGQLRHVPRGRGLVEAASRSQCRVEVSARSELLR
jgi:hypothetical protein